MTIPDASPAPSPAVPIRPKTSFAGDVLKLVSGTTIAQLIGILASPILTRLYAPEAFGALALFTSITSILGVIACLRYELAIMLPESDEDAANLLGVSLLSALLIALLTVPVIWWGRDLLLGWLNAPELAPYLWMVPPFVFLTGVFLALNYWNSRTKRFGRLSIARVSRSIATTSTQLGFGIAGYATGGTMIGASVGGHTLATVVLGGQIWRDDRRLLLSAFNWRGMFDGLKLHRKFPLYSSWAGLLNSASVNLPTFLLSLYFTPAVVGFYALGYRLLNVPGTVLGSAVSQVFFQKASVSRLDGTLSVVVESVFRHLAQLVIYPFLLLGIVGPELFQVVFGTKWIEAGVYVQILAPWLLFVMIGSPISTLGSVLELQKMGLVFNIFLIVTRSASLMIGGIRQDIIMALTLFSASGTILWAWFTSYLVVRSGVSLIRFSRLLGGQLFVALLFVLPTAATKWLFTASPEIILCIGAAFLPLYYLYTGISDHTLRTKLVEFTRSRSANS